MKKRNNFLLIALFIFAFAPAFGEEVTITTADGETYHMEVDPEEKLADFEEKVLALSNGHKRPYLVEFNNSSDLKKWSLKTAHTKGGYLGYPRNYYADISDQKDDIRLIVTSLANKSLVALAVAKLDLEAAGGRIEHVHPLRFLMTIFTDEELKVGIRNIRGRGWVWNQFVGGIKEALTTETKIGNMKSEYVLDFANTVKINPAIIIPAISNQKWDEFVDLLITHIPRLGDPDRYDS